MTTPTLDTLKQTLTERARQLGFDVVGIAPPELAPEHIHGLKEFIAHNHHGEMQWMAERVELRSNPQAIMPRIGSIITLGMNYGPESDPMALLDEPDKGLISVYARNEDYHDVMKGRLKQLAGWLASKGQCDVKVFVDTAPVMEKPIAAQSGIGWQGKHTCIVSREYGSWLFLGIIYTTLPFKTDTPEQDHCGSCTRCLDICPTNAFTASRKLDARKCISYLTIEHPGHIPLEFRRPMQNRIYGCDDCLAVCPWNKFAHTASESAFHARDELNAPQLSDLLTLDNAGFRQLFRKSPIKRIGRDRFIRNVLIAAGNSQDQGLIPLITPLLADSSPLVRAMAVWALGELLDTAAFSSMASTYKRQEKDPDVRSEWDHPMTNAHSPTI